MRAYSNVISSLLAYVDKRFAMEESFEIDIAKWNNENTTTTNKRQWNCRRKKSEGVERR